MNIDIKDPNDYLNLQLKYKDDPDLLAVLRDAHTLAVGVKDLLWYWPNDIDDAKDKLENVFY